MKKKIQAFTLAEALILLLIAALLAAALVPVITRKHKDVGEHGEWVCTMNSDGKHVVKTTYRGKVSEFEVAHNGGEYCIFSPPAAAKNFTIKAVGGGGGGAGGSDGDIETIYDSRMSDGENQVFTGTVDTDGAYSVVYGGGGGAGGGMACGEARDQTDTLNEDFNDKSLFENDESTSGYHGGYGHNGSWNYTNQNYNPYTAPGHCTKLSDSGNITCDIESPHSVPNPKRHYEFGFVDQPIPDFDYNMLKQNDQKFTDKYNYGKTDKKVTVYDANGNKVTGVSIYDAKYDYKYIQVAGTSDKTQLQNRALCFAEDNWPMSRLNATADADKGLYLKDKEASKPNIKCWNLPGIGGRSATIVTEPQVVELSAGQSIYASVGQGGKGQVFVADGSNPSKATNKVRAYLLGGAGDLALKDQLAYNGWVGRDGTDTIINFGKESKVAKGATGGAARYLMKVNYINIPVHECRVDQNRYMEDNASYCPSTTTMPSQCNNPGCSVTGIVHHAGDCKSGHYETTTDAETGETSQTYVCDSRYTQDVYSCYTGQHEMYSYDISSDCVVAIRPQYFTNTLNINACIYSSEIPTDHPEYGDFTKLDFPYLNPEVKLYVPGTSPSEDGSVEDDISAVTLKGRTKYEGNAGSGGYGAGEETRNYIQQSGSGSETFARFVGDDGAPGFAAIYRSSAYGGTGGQAGQYISTMVKKLDKLKITVGKPGKGGTASQNGLQGGETVVQETTNNQDMFVLQGGIGGQAKKLNVVNGAGIVPGGDGTASPVENESNRAKIIPLGGGSGINGSLQGQTAAIANIWGKANGMPTTSFGVVGTSVSLNLVGGHVLDMTYGAGGGGGGGSSSTAGVGGAGTPGAVIIKW